MISLAKYFPRSASASDRPSHLINDLCHNDPLLYIITVMQTTLCDALLY